MSKVQQNGLVAIAILTCCSVVNSVYKVSNRIVNDHAKFNDPFEERVDNVTTHVYNYKLSPLEDNFLVILMIAFLIFVLLVSHHFFTFPQTTNIRLRVETDLSANASGKSFLSVTVRKYNDVAVSLRLPMLSKRTGKVVNM